MKKITGIEIFLIKHYSVILRKNPKSYLFFPLADAYRRRGMIEIAVDICLKGLKLHPNYLTARTLLGELYFISAQYEKAERELNIVVQKVSNNIVARKILFDIYLKKGEADKAIKLSDEILTLCGDSKTKNSLQEEIIRQVSTHRKPQIQHEEISGNVSQKDITKSVKSKGDDIIGKEFLKIGNMAEEGNIIDDDAAFKEIESIFEKCAEVDQSNITLKQRGKLKVFEKMLSNIKSSSQTQEKNGTNINC